MKSTDQTIYLPARRSASVKALSADRGSCDESHLSGFRMLSMENDDELRLGEDSISDKIVEDISLSRYLIAFDLQTACKRLFRFVSNKANMLTMFIYSTCISGLSRPYIRMKTQVVQHFIFVFKQTPLKLKKKCLSRCVHPLRGFFTPLSQNGFVITGAQMHPTNISESRAKNQNNSA